MEPKFQTIELPLLPLRDIVVFPYMVAPLFVGRDKSVVALKAAMEKDKRIFLATQKNAGVDNPAAEDIATTGTIGKVLQLLKLPDGTVKALIEGLERATISQFIEEKDSFSVRLQPLVDLPGDTGQLSVLVRILRQSFVDYAKLNKKISRELVKTISTINDPSRLGDSMAAHFGFKVADKQRLLEAASLTKRLELLLELVKIEMDVTHMDRRIKKRVKEQMDKTQRNYYLNEKMRAIKEEMGGDPLDPTDDLQELEKEIEAKKMSGEATEKVTAEFKKLRQMPPMSAEATVVRTYIDWLLSLPWFEKSEVLNDLKKAEEILDEDHYGLEKPKERIVEYLAVQSLTQKVRGPILCLVGPPGVGKTSLAKSVARATGRNYIRLSLGGVRDEAEIRGHRRTYIGALPGKIIQSLKKAGTNNPVFCLDEVDKMSMDFRGDPSAALLEVLDPEQNNAFNDHYLDVDYDLSDILFITTANTLPSIPAPLQDRMEIIRIPGYTEIEKYHIAKGFLVPKQITANGLEEKPIAFTKKVLMLLIQRYTREAGVRELERQISSICRKVARNVVLANLNHPEKDPKKIQVTEKTVQRHLGPPPYRYGQLEETDQVGLSTGLAWTQVGGELLSIETILMPGKGKYVVTGKLGDVMKESAQAAISYVRSRAKELKIDNKFHEELDLHIHIPEGAIPKDGPSAGIALCTSIVSALTQKPVSRLVAMTGEITLRGRVLPIGGLKEKLLAAHRGGIRMVLIPEENRKDLHDVPANILKQVKVVSVGHMDEVLSHALVVGDGESLFQPSDMPFNVQPPPDKPQPQRPLN